MEAAASRPLFSSNRNEAQKSVKLIRNLLEDSRGTFRGTFAMNMRLMGKSTYKGRSTWNIP
jgi:hypothetical protein